MSQKIVPPYLQSKPADGGDLDEEDKKANGVEEREWSLRRRLRRSNPSETGTMRSESSDISSRCDHRKDCRPRTGLQTVYFQRRSSGWPCPEFDDGLGYGMMQALSS